MKQLVSWAAARVFVCALLASPLDAQDIGGQVVLNGRVEDAVSREPIEGARVFSPDSSSVVFTDSLGAFVIPVRAAQPLAIQAEGFGYEPDRFELDEGAPSRISILLLEPSPIDSEGIRVVDESAVTVLVENLKQRRISTRAPLAAFDRAQLEPFLGSSVSDFVGGILSRLKLCDDDPDQICLPGRWQSFAALTPETRVLVCVDGWISVSPARELGVLGVESVALIEIFGGVFTAQVRVYTPQWILSQARAGLTEPPPLVIGCG